MAVNKATLDLIVEFEGLRTEAYADPAHGWTVPTIGVGHTSAAGPPKVFKGQTITREEAYEILARDLQAVEAQVRRAVKVPLNENQLGALVSFTFNLGSGNLAKSTLLRKLNAGDYAGAAGEFSKWNNAAGKPMAGLTRRRTAEAALFRRPSAVPYLPASEHPPYPPKPVPSIPPSTVGEPMETELPDAPLEVTPRDERQGNWNFAWILFFAAVAACLAILIYVNWPTGGTP